MSTIKAVKTPTAVTEELRLDQCADLTNGHLLHLLLIYRSN